MIISESKAPVDSISSEIIALSFFQDERPLQGITGLADWRMNGELSRIIINGRLTGAEGETFLTTTGRRFASPRLLLFGLGASEQFQPERFQELFRRFITVLNRLDLRIFAFSIPGSTLFTFDKANEYVRAELERCQFPEETEAVILTGE